MTSGSEKARPAHRTAWFIILAALLLAFVSGSMAEQAPVERSEAVEVQERAAPEVAAKASERTEAAVRPYHAEETSQEAGAFGFWLLFSLWAVLLLAGVTPRLLQILRRSGAQDLRNGRLTVR
jgi:hypothetical protein